MVNIAIVDDENVEIERIIECIAEFAQSNPFEYEIYRYNNGIDFLSYFGKSVLFFVLHFFLKEFL